MRILLALLWVSVSSTAAALPTSPATGEIGSGTLLIRADGPGRHVPAPLVDTDVHMRVTGLVARVRVRQSFRNPGDGWVEGVYVFPLPDESAVDRLRMRVGERVVEGRIRERAAAKRAYARAKRSGRRASLVEQERPNLFTTSVANIGPDETVVVEIEYQQTLAFRDGGFSLRFPMVVGPRYVPGSPVAETDESVARVAGSGWATPTDLVPDADRITPPVEPPGGPPVNPVTLAVALDAGLPLASIESPSHPVEVEHGDGGRARVRLARAPVRTDRDFVLRWRPEVGATPRAALFTEHRDDALYALLMVVPPLSPPVRERLRREVIFVVDTSGSMGGASIRQAKAALSLAIERLRDGDRFNVVEFASRTRLLWRTSRPASRLTREHALAFVGALDAGGGTEMAGALRAALAPATDERWMRQVVFLTDGAVGNEEHLLGIVHRRLGGARLFTVGIGSAPNGYFMRRAARIGRGTHTWIGDVAAVEERMEALFARLERPLMRDVRVQWPVASGAVEAWPEPLPDLYEGEPLVVTARLERAGGEARVHGTRAARPWTTRVPLDGGGGESGLHALWARRKIASLEESRVRGADEAEVREAVLEVALAHSLVSRYTSLVAVDVTPARPPGTDAARRPVATDLPAGWDYAKVFGPLPGTATPAMLHLLVGALALAGAALARRRARR